MRNLINKIITLMANPSLNYDHKHVRKAPSRKRINKSKRNRSSEKAMRVFRSLTSKRFMEVKESKNDWGLECIKIDNDYIVDSSNTSIADAGEIKLEIIPMIRKPLKGVMVNIKPTQEGLDNFNKMVHEISEFSLKKEQERGTYSYKNDQDTAEFFAKNYINDQKLYSELKYKFPLKEEKRFMSQYKSCLTTILARWELLDGYPQDGEYYSKEAKNDYRAFLGMFCDIIEDKPVLGKTAYYTDVLPQIVATAKAKDGSIVKKVAKFEFVEFGTYSYDEEYRIESSVCDGKFKSLTPAFLNKVVANLVNKIGSKCYQIERAIKQEKRNKLAKQVVSGLEYLIKVDDNGKTLADERNEIIDFIGANMTPKMKRELPGVKQSSLSTFKITLAGNKWAEKRSIRITFNEGNGGSFTINEQIPFLDDARFTKDELIAWVNAQIGIINLMRPNRLEEAKEELASNFEMTRSERSQAIA